VGVLTKCILRAFSHSCLFIEDTDSVFRLVIVLCQKMKAKMSLFNETYKSVVGKAN